VLNPLLYCWLLRAQPESDFDIPESPIDNIEASHVSCNVLNMNRASSPPPLASTILISSYRFRQNMGILETSEGV
jgi:hypothetical protein